MAKFKLIDLPYAQDALEPVISAETVAFHHGKHLQTYVNNLNAAIEGGELEDKSLEEIVCKATGGVFNNAGQVLNHNLYFLQFKAPSADNLPCGEIAKAIDAQFGSFEKFKEEFSAKAASLFGSGWAWLSSDKEGKLVISQESGASNPVTKGLKPLMCADVWEHAYYIDYRNRRPEYLVAFWQILDWEEIDRRFKA